MVTEALPAISIPGEHLQMSVTKDGIAIITIDSKAEKVGVVQHMAKPQQPASNF